MNQSYQSQYSPYGMTSMGTNRTPPDFSQNSSLQTSFSHPQNNQWQNTRRIYSNTIHHQNPSPRHNLPTIHQTTTPRQNTPAIRNPYKQPIRSPNPVPRTHPYSYPAQNTSSRYNRPSSTGINMERNEARNLNENMGSLSDSDLAEFDDIIQRRTAEYNNRRAVTNQRIQHVHTAQNMTSGHQIIDLTQEEETDPFDTIPDDALLSVRIPETQNSSQKRRRIERNPYKK